MQPIVIAVSTDEHKLGYGESIMNITTEVEREFKYLVTKQVFEKLKCDLSAKYSYGEFYQKNIYYDTEDLLLHRNHETLRARVKENSITLEYKFGKKYASGLRTCSEKSISLSRIPSLIPSDIKASLKINSSLDLVELGFLETYRTNFIFDGMTISLDYNIYLETEDYEVEIEVDDITKFQSLDILKFLDVSNNSVGKYTRFIAKYINNCT